ncbi:MAG: hypothetical protein COV67_08145 [Nitrospinae bacterium CG11_big_fil_rev_8_21_14_0_20_56_8]|nr:MAG: hypothetical protein COV67_08145 [Nitrospinae bacterium CG11_big_fil_rev_8_21_14_0_20_56_8]
MAISSIGGISGASAYESLAGHTPILKCQTTCHKAKNLEYAKVDKTRLTVCKDCHTGVAPGESRNPFQKTAHFILTSKKTAPKTSTSPPPSVPPQHSKFPTSGMASIPAGEFIMGSNERWDDESPEYIAHTNAYSIDIYEVTNEDYKKFVTATGHELPYHWPEGEIPKGKEKHPVIYVNWFDARDYCEWAGKRLPTEEEWEKAARGENGYIYPWGNEWTVHKSNNPYKGSTGTEPAGSYPEGKSPYGLYDMSGNVWEWVDSYYLPHPGNMVPRAEYGTDKRILKGGSWFDCLSYGCGLSAPTFNRSFFTPEVRNNSFGFRCAKSS